MGNLLLKHMRRGANGLLMHSKRASYVPRTTRFQFILAKRKTLRSIEVSLFGHNILINKITTILSLNILHTVYVS